MRSVSRRSVLIGTGTVAAIGLAGCSAAADGGTDDVHVINETDEQIDGTVEIVGPNGDTALSDAFDVAPQGEVSNARAAYKRVWGAIGDYKIIVELADGFDVGGETRATETVTVEDTDSKLLTIVLGADDRENGISFAVGERWGDSE